MGKRDTKETITDTKTNQNIANANYAGARTDNANEISQGRTNVDTGRTDVGNLYKGMVGSNPYSVLGNASYSNVDTGALAGIGSRWKDFGAGISKGYDDTNAAIDQVNTNLGNVRGDYKGITDSLNTLEAKNPAIEANIQKYEDMIPGIQKDVDQLSTMGKTGGLDDEQIARMRGLGVFDEMARTGGYDDTARANLRARGLSSISATQKNAQDEMDRRLAVQGGYGPGFDAANRALRRDTARNLTDTTLKTETDLQDKINTGRTEGAKNLSGAEKDLQTLRTGNMLLGSRGAVEGGLGIQEAGSAANRNRIGLQDVGVNINNARTGAQNSRVALERLGLDTAQAKGQVQDSINRYMAMGLDGETATARAIADVETANSQGNMQAGMFNINNAQGVQANNINNDYRGIQGQESMYNTDVEQLNNNENRGVNLLNAGTDADLGYLQNRTALSKGGGFGDTMSAIGSGAAAGWGALKHLFGGAPGNKEPLRKDSPTGTSGGGYGLPVPSGTNPYPGGFPNPDEGVDECTARMGPEYYTGPGGVCMLKPAAPAPQVDTDYTVNLPPTA